jgi:hypothetical protein
VAVTTGATTPNISAALLAAGHITGTVTAQVGGGTLANIDVQACVSDGNGGWNSVADTQTAGDGTYDLGSLPTGSYRVQFQDFSGDYIAQWYHNQPDFSSANPVAVTAGATTPNKDAALLTAGHITGTVTKAGGGALANIDVQACVSDGNGGWNTISEIQTAADGTYDLGGLPTGSYRVQFQDVSGDHIAQWYHNQPDFSSANPVAVTAGATTPNIDAALLAAGHITGTVTAQVGGGTLGNIWVNVYASVADYNNGNPAANTRTNSDGTYDLGSLPAGSYLVEFRDDINGDYATQYYHAKSTIDSADPVAVTAGATTPNINAALLAAGHITGTVTRAGGGTLGSFNVWAWVSDGSGGWRVASSSKVADDGSYDVGGLAVGTYRVSFGDITGDYLGQWYDNKPDVASADPVTIVHAGDTMPNINATLLVNTPAGNNIAVVVDEMGLLGPVEFTYSTVTVTGITSVTTSFSDPGSATFEVVGPTFWALDTTATYDTSGDKWITVGLPYDPTGLTLAQQQALKIMHFDGGAWIDVTYSVDTTAHTVYGRVKHLSWFALGVDTKPPTTTVTGADGAWHNSPVALSFTPTDAAGGSGMSGGSAKTEYKLDSGVWTTGTSLTVATNGTHTVSYRSTDAAGNTEAAKSVTVKIDTGAPTTTLSGLPSGWVNHSVTLSLSASDALSGFAYSEYSLNGGAFTRASSLTISTPGTTTIGYCSADNAGNLDVAQSATVRIDTGIPTAAASKNVTVKHGKKASLAFTVRDPAPSCGAASVTIVVKLKKKTVKTITIANASTNKAQSCSFKITLKKGSYTWSVKATDIAGNAGKASGTKKLIVK